MDDEEVGGGFRVGARVAFVRGGGRALPALLYGSGGEVVAIVPLARGGSMAGVAIDDDDRLDPWWFNPEMLEPIGIADPATVSAEKGGDGGA